MTIKSVKVIVDDKKYIPESQTSGSAGYDLTAKSMDYDADHRCWIYDVGLKIEIPRGYFGDIRPRSSIYKKGPYVLTNSCGVVDSDYQGPLKFVFRCVDDTWDVLSSPPYEIGDRVGQIILVPYSKMDIEVVKVFDTKTDRGEGGFGSTDKKSKKKKSPKTGA